jgi:ATP-dependent RNA helicase DeaD
VKPGNIVGAIANEAGLDGEHIGHIDIHTEYSLVDLPAGMPNDVFQDLRKTRVCGQALKISRLDEAAPKNSGSGKQAPAKKGGGKAAGKKKAGSKPAPAKKAHRKGAAKKRKKATP